MFFILIQGIVIMVKMINGLSFAAVLALATMTSGCIPSCAKKEAPKQEAAKTEETDTMAAAEATVTEAEATTVAAAEATEAEACTVASAEAPAEVVEAEQKA